jgi:Rieske Fe-S protein
VTAREVLPKNAGEVLTGQHVALYRDAAGELHAISSVCTHRGCDVHWNDANKVWDCPCHGSRFSPTGEVVHGPAAMPLPRVDIPEEWKG